MMIQVKPALLILMVVLSTTGGSTVTFQASPSVLLENLTTSSSMRCGVSHNASDPTNNIRHVTSIFVTNHEDADVASVTAFDAPAALADLGNLQVKGSVSGEEFLQLSWADPAHMTLGKYTCTINAIGVNGHNEVLTSELLMTSETPSVMDLIEDLQAKGQSQKLEIQKQHDYILHQQQEIAQQKQDIAHQKQDIAQQKQDIVQQKQESLKQQQEIQELKQTLQLCSTNVVFMSSMSSSRFTQSQLTVQPGQTVVYDDSMLNIGGNYNNSTGMFTCVVPGVYAFQSHAWNSDGTRISLNMKHNTNTVVTLYAGYTGGFEADSVAAVLRLKAGDVVKMVTTYASTFHDEAGLRKSNTFSGHLVKAEGCQ